MNIMQQNFVLFTIKICRAYRLFYAPPYEINHQQQILLTFQSSEITQLNLLKINITAV